MIPSRNAQFQTLGRMNPECSATIPARAAFSRCNASCFGTGEVASEGKFYAQDSAVLCTDIPAGNPMQSCCTMMQKQTTLFPACAISNHEAESRQLHPRFSTAELLAGSIGIRNHSLIRITRFEGSLSIARSRKVPRNAVSRWQCLEDDDQNENEKAVEGVNGECGSWPKTDELTADRGVCALDSLQRCLQHMHILFMNWPR
ncbi:hypothetical protein F5Y18DRAFT_271079 [Xylariaceae sp. FL1019]|nr:hypothetical protein F5Y18DRAFT_271079 [Xylariaceae sp. FL1019]